MPVKYLSTGRTAGEECSSTYEGRHITIEESMLIHPYHADGFVDKGDPVLVNNGTSPCIVGVAFTSASAATDLIAIDTEGIWYLNVLGRVSDQTGDGIALALGAGDPVAIMVTPASATTILTGESDYSHFRPFGYVLGDVTAHVTNPTVVAVKVHNAPIALSGRLQWGAGFGVHADCMLLEGDSTLRRTNLMKASLATESLLQAGEQIQGLQIRIMDDLIATGGRSRRLS